MPGIDRHIFEAYEIEEDGYERFVANAFALQEDQQRKLLTAQHVAAELRGKRVRLRSADGSEVLENPEFLKRGDWGDIAEAPISGTGGLQPEFEIGSDANLKIVSSADGGRFRDDHSLEVTQLSNSIIRYHGRNTNQISAPGSSGAPIIDAQGRVVAVHSSGGWDKGVNKGSAWRLKRSGS